MYALAQRRNPAVAVAAAESAAAISQALGRGGSSPDVATGPHGHGPANTQTATGLGRLYEWRISQVPHPTEVPQ